jgi:hypothetical protein
MAFSDARNERDRAETGRNSTNHGGGDARAAERRNREAMARNREVAERARYSQSMRSANMANLAGPPGFSSAAHSYNNRSGLWDALDFITGGLIDLNKPNPTVPESFKGGDWHTSTNPGGVIGGLLGGALVPGGGLVLGPAGSWAWDQTGIGDIWHGQGIGTGAPAAPAPGGGTGQGGQWAGLQGGPMAPRPGQVTPATPAGPMAPQTATAVPGAWLGVPGPTPYGLMMPGWRA